MESLKQTVQSLVAAKKNVARLETRFLRQLSRIARNGSSSGPGGGGLPRKLKCPRCTRRFALPLHLGRHLAVTHKQRARPAKKSSG